MLYSAALRAAPLRGSLRRVSSAHIATVPTDGMCGVSWLRNPTDFNAAGKAALEVCNALVDIVGSVSSRATSPNAQEGVACLRQLDTVSDTLCKVLDAAEFMRQNHARDAWRDGAEDTYRSLASYMHMLNTHRPLHQALVAVTSNSAVMGALTTEQQRMAVLLQREFEREGIHLPDDQRSQLVALNDAVHEAAAVFQGGTQQLTGAFAVRDLPTLLKAHAPEFAREAGSALSSHPHAVLDSLLQTLPQPEVRMRVVAGRDSECAPNLSALHSLRDRRHDLATRIGFPTYAHMVLADRMAGNPENVGTFLRNMRSALAPRLASDLAMLSDAKRALFGSAAAAADPGVSLGPEAIASARKAIAAGRLPSELPRRPSDAGSMRDNLAALQDAPVYHWDLPLLQRLVATSISAAALGETGRGAFALGSDADDSPLAAEYRRYASVGAVMRGLSTIVQRCFGVSMVREDVGEGEAWDTPQAPSATGSAASWLRQLGAAGTSPAPRSQLLKYRLVHESEGELGTIYFDLFARPGKFGGAAHYVIRCGKATHEYDGPFEASLGAPSPSLGGVQLPIVALVTNVMHPHMRGEGGESPVSLSALEAVGLLPREVETLFHEFGHALHSVLSRTQFQHLHGTRAALDFVELPSHTLEYFARDYRVAAATWAVHPSSDRPMPPELWEAVHAPRRAFRSLDLQGTLTHAALDLGLYGPPSACGLSAATLAEDAKSSNRCTAWHTQLLEATQNGHDVSSLDIPLAAPDIGEAGKHHLTIGAAAPSALGAWQGDSRQLYRSVQHRFSLLPPVPGSAWHAGLVHLVSYASGYYSYLYAHAFSAEVWRTLFAGDPLSRDAGEAYRRGLLAPGSGADPAGLIAGVLGRPPSLGSLVRELQER